MPETESKRVTAAYCKKQLEKVQNLVQILNKLEKEERAFLFHVLGDDALHTLSEVIYNVCVQSQDSSSEETEAFFKLVDEVCKDHEHAENLYSQLSEDSDIEKKRKKFLQQEGTGFGLITALLPLVTGLLGGILKK